MPDHTPRFPTLIDSTMLVTFKECPQKFYREYCQRYGISTTSPDLHAGGAIAQGMQEFRDSYYAPASPTKGDFEKCRIRALASFMQYWGTYDPPSYIKDGKEVTHNKTFVNTAAAFLDYLDYYPPSPTAEEPQHNIEPYYGPDNKPATEFTFAIPLPVNHPETGEPILYAGRFDMLGVYGEHIWIVDEKTTKQFESGWVDKWGMRTQFIGYTWAARQYGIEAHGAIVRGIAIQKTQAKFLQATVPYTDATIHRWANQLIRDVQSMVLHWEQGYWDYDFGSSCTMYFGCPFLHVCPRDEPDRWLYEFTERTWNPLAQDPTETRIKVFHE